MSAWGELLSRAYLACNGQDVDVLPALVGDDVGPPDDSQSGVGSPEGRGRESGASRGPRSSRRKKQR